jgi:hypothetical protein
MNACSVNQGVCHRGQKWAFFLIQIRLAYQPDNWYFTRTVLSAGSSHIKYVYSSSHTYIYTYIYIYIYNLYIGIYFVQEIHNLDAVCMMSRHLLD